MLIQEAVTRWDCTAWGQSRHGRDEAKTTAPSHIFFGATADAIMLYSIDTPTKAETAVLPFVQQFHTKSHISCLGLANWPFGFSALPESAPHPGLFRWLLTKHRAVTPRRQECVGIYNLLKVRHLVMMVY